MTRELRFLVVACFDLMMVFRSWFLLAVQLRLLCLRLIRGVWMCFRKCLDEFEPTDLTLSILHWIDSRGIT